MHTDNEYQSKLERLLVLQGTDPGFFVLAVHSFIESTLRERYCLMEAEVSFTELVKVFKDDSTQDAKAGQYFNTRIRILTALKEAHKAVNDVRHRFSLMSEEDARIATVHLKEFCSLVGIPDSTVLVRLHEYLSLWDARKPLGVLWDEYERLYREHLIQQKEKEDLIDDMMVLTELQQTTQWLNVQLIIMNQDMKKVELLQNRDHKKIDELRRKRYELTEELKRVNSEAAQLQGVRVAFDALQKMSLYTRTRGDYERVVVRLSFEQQEVVNHISLTSDFLIRGRAGTGKTLVLLKAMEKVTGSPEPEVPVPSYLLLTYTNALVKYDRYLQSVFASDRDEDSLKTADAFMLDTLHSFDPLITVDADILSELLDGIHIHPLDSKGIAHEIENFIWAGDLTKEEYVEQMVKRAGMSVSLKQDQREAVWGIKEEVEEKLAQRDGKPFRYLRYLLLRNLETCEDFSAFQVDYLFVDEAQDLDALTLKVLKKLTRRALILAGDEQQSIYQQGFSFKRAGIDIVGTSRLLTLNFRNSVQIHSLAERYRTNSGKQSARETGVEAFRDGPPVELFQKTSQTKALAHIAKRVRFFIDFLGYERENICIITVSKSLFGIIASALDEQGITSEAIVDADFSFSSSGSVRLTTMHSAKGLDFPVVLLYLPGATRQHSEYDGKVNDMLLRNLIYVSLTRAMEHLNIFTLSSSSCHAIQDLKALVPVTIGP
ncbi:MAG: UvrD-helicase domain-containing protein [Sphaerochaetaceae bacterium]|nr:UvrD-helicase domain-containing protein [Sphaerochaetaceae bacterium]